MHYSDCMLTMKVLIVEDDTLMRDLLVTLAISIEESLDVVEADSVESALSLWRESTIELILCDWHLPGTLDGIDLVRQIRKEDAKVPILMITGQADRQKVISSARLGVNAFISKPFQVEDVIRRLKPFIQPEGATANAAQPELEEFLTWAADPERHQHQLDSIADVRPAIDALQQDPPPTARSLSKAWQGNPSITTHLIRLSNSASMSRKGTHVNNLLDAVALMGVDMALQQVVALSLNEHGQLRDQRLIERQAGFATESQTLAQQAAQLAQQLGETPSLAYTAGLLHRLGETAVLLLAQRYLDQGGALTEDTIDQALTNLSSGYGNLLKVSWHLPLPLRELIGASHWLPRDAVRRELILMRVAACRIKDDTDSLEYLRAERQLGLDS